MADKLYHRNDQLKNCKVKKYKIDNNLKVLYEVSTIYQNLKFKILKTLPLEQLDNNATDFFFMLMKNYQCENFIMYYDNDYDIKTIINLITNQPLVLTSEQLAFLKRFFINIKNAIIFLFDNNIKPIINETSNNNVNNISNSLQTKQRILN